MNFYTGKLYLFLSCIITLSQPTPCSEQHNTINRGQFVSNLKTQRFTRTTLQTLEQHINQHINQYKKAPCPPNSPISPFKVPEKPLLKKFSANIIDQTNNLDTTANDDFIPIDVQSHVEFDTSRTRALNINCNNNILHQSAVKALFEGYTTPYKNSEKLQHASSAAWSTAGNASPCLTYQIIKSPTKPQQLISSVLQQHDSRIDSLLSKTEQDVANVYMHKKQTFMKIAAIGIPITAARLLEHHNPQNRFGGVVAATTIISMLPTIISAMGGFYAMYKIEQMLHAEERVAITHLKHAIATENQKRDENLAQELKQRDEALKKEIIERINADRQEKAERIKADQERLLQITSFTTDIKKDLYEATKKYDLASDCLNEALHKIDAVEQTNNDLRTKCAFIMPKLDAILEHALTMRQNMEKSAQNNATDPRLENIEYALKSAEDRTNEAEEKPESSCKIRPRRALSISDQLLPAGLHLTPDHAHVDSNAFQQQFKKPHHETHVGLTSFLHTGQEAFAHLIHPTSPIKQAK